MLRPVPETDPQAEESGGKTCPAGVCDGSGWVLQEDNTTVPCECRGRRIGRALSRDLGTGIPKRFRGLSFDRKPLCDLDPVVTRHVRGYISDLDSNVESGRGLWFYGDTGTGKTSLAMLVAREAIEKGWSVAVYPLGLLLAELRGSYEPDRAESFMTLFRKVCSVDLLVLDGLGSERLTDHMTDQIYSIVNERWQDKAPVIVTSDLPKADRAATLEELGKEVDRLRDRSEREGSAGELAGIVSRLERLTAELDRLVANPHHDALHPVRSQLGDRTVSRLIEICDDPIPIMGPDLRLTSAG